MLWTFPKIIGVSTCSGLLCNEMFLTNNTQLGKRIPARYHIDIRSHRYQVD